MKLSTRSRYGLRAIVELAMEYGKPLMGIQGEALDLLTAYSWPGNVRELKNAVESAVIVATGPEIAVQDIPVAIRQAGAVLRGASVPTGMTIQEMEQGLIQSTLAEVEGNREKAAVRLGISERTLYRKIKGYETAE